MKEKESILDNYKDLLSVADLAEIFNTTKGTIYKELRLGKFGEPIKIGRKYLVLKVLVRRRFFNSR